MFIRYLFTTTHAGQPLSATFDTPDFLPTDRDVYLIPGHGGFNCVGCVGFHFINSYRDRDMVQFNDRRSGGALSFSFPKGTFTRTGNTPTNVDVGSGMGNLLVTANA